MLSKKSKVIFFLEVGIYERKVNKNCVPQAMEEHLVKNDSPTCRKRLRKINTNFFINIEKVHINDIYIMQY